ncbi:MAG: DUF2752 domain-containing protein [Clostridia bacterium]|nr:DUF2752 domain-containing protein [Clostridia bacterium]
MKRAARICVLPLFALAVASVFVYAYLKRPFDGGAAECPYDRFFHLHCLTCGATRAAYSILYFDFKSAFYYNALFTVGIIPAALVGGAAAVNFALGKRAIPLPKFRGVYAVAAVAVALIFVVLRNFTGIIY